jgi:hypothetical protein
MSAVQQALGLLGQSLTDVELATDAITATSSGVAAAVVGGGHGCTAADVAAIAATVSFADTRAEDISRMARQLLGVLREYPRRNTHLHGDGDGQAAELGRAGTYPGEQTSGMAVGSHVKEMIRGAVYMHRCPRETSTSWAVGVFASFEDCVMLPGLI